MSPKKKIFYLITKSNQGGAQRNVCDLATGISPKLFDVSVFAGGDGWLFDELTKKNIHAESLPFLARDVRFFAEIAVFFKLLSLFKKERPDIVHLHSSKAGALGALAARLAGVEKIIFTAHGWAFNEPRFFLSRAAIWLVSWLTTLLAHRIIVITKKEYAQTLAMPLITAKKIAYIPNGIDNIHFLPKKEAQEKLLGPQAKSIDADTIWIGTISELTANKGLKYAIEATAIIKKGAASPFVFVVIGEGEERKALEKQIVDYKLSGTVFLAGYKKDAHTLLKAFDIFTLTSLKEGLPYALLEAGAAGLPTVASNVGGIPDIVGEESGILVPPQNPEAIAQALKKLITDRSAQKPTEEPGARRIQETYSLQKMLHDTVSLYK
ncbi:MAG: glycosyltransferase [Candidatus Lloydbacteria bacterium]|nr:glycosyltransferase [Candidatus Lloydbacteria bacterium]